MKETIGKDPCADIGCIHLHFVLLCVVVWQQFDSANKTSNNLDWLDRESFLRDILFYFEKVFLGVFWGFFCRSAPLVRRRRRRLPAHGSLDDRPSGLVHPAMPLDPGVAGAPITQIRVGVEPGRGLQTRVFL